MKFLILLLLIFPKLILAQEVFIDSSNKEYLYLGSTQNNKQSFMDLNIGTIDWINKAKVERMQQIGILSPAQFWNKVTNNSIGFYASGYEPFWKAKITKNRLQFFHLKEDNIAIKIDIKNSNLTYDFVAFFYSQNGVIGLIRNLDKRSKCALNIDEPDSIYEIFINYKGEIFEGCAYLDKL